MPRSIRGRASTDVINEGRAPAEAGAIDLRHAWEAGDLAD